MNDSKKRNVFKFSLYQENLLLCEMILDADQFNPFTRYSINIRDILPKSIVMLQKVLSKRTQNYDFIIDIGKNSNGQNCSYDLLELYRKNIESYPSEIRNLLEYNPQPIVQFIDDKTIRGVECKIGMYINDNPIVERLFYVDRYNPEARLSVDLLNTFIYIVDEIYKKIKKTDIKNIWDDYDLINVAGLSIEQIRELSLSDREMLLSKIGC